MLDLEMNVVEPDEAGESSILMHAKSRSLLGFERGLGRRPETWC